MHDKYGHILYSRTCDHCGKSYVGRGEKYCSIPCCNKAHTKNLNSRFWSKVNITDLFDCWNWNSTKNKQGYGHITIENKTIKAHRFSYFINFGTIPDNLCVLHHCNNPSCVNPAHLYLGTTQDNTNDMLNANRQAKGEKNGNAKLTEKQVIEIIELLKTDIKQSKIAKKFSVTQTPIFYIKKGHTWKHLPR
jgi:hypothetical protein